MAKEKLPFELDKPNANTPVTQAECVGYGENGNVKEELDKINGSFSKESTQSEEEAVRFETDGGNLVGKVDITGADFTNLKRGGQQVARMSDLPTVPTLDTSIGSSPSNSHTPSTKAVKDYVDANALGDLPISEESTQSEVEEFVASNDAGTDTYAKVGSYGVKAKAYKKLNGDDAIPPIDTTIGDNPSNEHTPSTQAVKNYVDNHGGVGNLPISGETSPSEDEEAFFGNDACTDNYVKIGSYGIKAKAYKKLNGDDAFPDLTIEDFDIENAHHRAYKAELANPFRYSAADKAYIVLTIDDANQYLPEMYDLCHNINIPLSPAVPPENINSSYTTGYDYINDTEITVSPRTVKSILNAVISDGGEVLSHSDRVLGTDSPMSTYNIIIRDSKRELEKNGFKVRGLIVPGGTPESGEGSAYYSQGTSLKVDAYTRRYYDYCDLYGAHVLGDEPYHHTRMYLWNYPKTTYPNVDNAISQVVSDMATKIANKELIILGMHGKNDVDSIEYVSNVRKLIEAIRSAYSEGTQFEFTTWANFYDAFASSLAKELYNI